MYIMYVDECGDSGMHERSSDYFILSAIVIHESRWTDFLMSASVAFDRAYEAYGLDRKLELHAKDMLGRSTKSYSTISKVSRVLLLRDILKFESTQSNVIRSINVMVNKCNKKEGYDVFGRAWDALISRFENTMEHANFPIVKEGTTAAYPEHGMAIVGIQEQRAWNRHTMKMAAMRLPLGAPY